jgi:hypothetical protein
MYGIVLFVYAWCCISWFIYSILLFVCLCRVVCLFVCLCTVLCCSYMYGVVLVGLYTAYFSLFIFGIALFICVRYCIVCMYVCLFMYGVVFLVCLYTSTVLHLFIRLCTVCYCLFIYERCCVYLIMHCVVLYVCLPTALHLFLIDRKPWLTVHRSCFLFGRSRVPFGCPDRSFSCIQLSKRSFKYMKEPSLTKPN